MKDGGTRDWGLGSANFSRNLGASRKGIWKPDRFRTGYAIRFAVKCWHCRIADNVYGHDARALTHDDESNTLTMMAKRLQVIVQDPEYRDIQRAARLRRMSIAEWVRQALVQARRSEPNREAASKLEAIRAAARMEFPTADIDRMLEEIELGYGSGVHP
jgi:hypothetical protein